MIAYINYANDPFEHKLTVLSSCYKRSSDVTFKKFKIYKSKLKLACFLIPSLHSKRFRESSFRKFMPRAVAVQIPFSRPGGNRPKEEQRHTWEQRNRDTEEQRHRGTETQRNRDTEEQETETERNRDTEEWRHRDKKKKFVID